MKLQYKRCIVFLIGIIILTLGVSLTVISDIGAGAYDSINFALADIFNIKVSFAINITSLFIVIIAGIVRNKVPRLTTFITAIIVGIFTDIWVNITNLISVNTMLSKIIVFIIGVFLVCFGIALYLIPKLPSNPTDDLMVAFTEKNISIKKAKLSIDTVCIVIAFLLKGPIGIGTILLTFLVGPTVDIFYNILIKYIKFNEMEETISI